MAVDIALPPSFAFQYPENAEDPTSEAHPRSTTHTLRHDICTRARNRASGSLHSSSGAAPPSDSDCEMSSSGYSASGQPEEDAPQLAVEDLKSDFEEAAVLALLDYLEACDQNEVPLNLHSDDISLLVQRSVGWLNQLLQTFDDALEPPATPAPIPLACLALVYRLLDPNIDSGPPQVADKDMERWMNFDHFQHDDLLVCTLQWFCVEYQNSTRVAVSARLLERSLEHYGRLFTITSLNSRHSSELDLLINLTYLWGRLTQPHGDDEDPHVRDAFTLVEGVFNILDLIYSTPSPLTSWALRALNSLWYRRSFPPIEETKKLRWNMLQRSLHVFASTNPTHEGFADNGIYQSMWSLLLIGTIAFPLQEENGEVWKHEITRACTPYLHSIILLLRPTFEIDWRILQCAVLKVLCSLNRVEGQLQRTLVPHLVAHQYLQQLFPSFFPIPNTETHLKKTLNRFKWSERRDLCSNDPQDFEDLLRLLIPPEGEVSTADPNAVPPSTDAAIEAIMADINNLAMATYADTDAGHGAPFTPTDFWDKLPYMRFPTTACSAPILVFQLCRIGLRPELALPNAPYNCNESTNEDPITIMTIKLERLLNTDNPHPVGELLRGSFLRRHMWEIKPTADAEECADFFERWLALAPRFIYHVPVLHPQATSYDVSWSKDEGAQCPVINGWPAPHTDGKLKSPPSEWERLRNAIHKASELKNEQEQITWLYHACEESELLPNGMAVGLRATQDFGRTARRYFHRNLRPAIHWALRKQPGRLDRVLEKPIILCFAVDLDRLQDIEGCVDLPVPDTTPALLSDPWGATIQVSRCNIHEQFRGPPSNSPLLRRLQSVPAIQGPIAARWDRQDHGPTFFTNDSQGSPSVLPPMQPAGAPIIDLAPHTKTLSELLAAVDQRPPLQLALDADAMTSILLASSLTVVFYPQTQLGARVLRQ